MVPSGYPAHPSFRFPRHQVTFIPDIHLDAALRSSIPSMSTPIVLPPGASYVAGAVLSTVYLLIYQLRTVIKYRGLSGVKYPRIYATDKEAEVNPNAMKFNCAQRAHQNTLENLPLLYSTTLITALKYPVFAASALGLWSLARVGYTLGYTTGDPKKRTNALSVLHYPIAITLLGASTYTVVQLILAEA
ncbi:MAPEG family [Mycena venus]|uniref:MAPEG family n=1 Tax=Mycena venus TaxID=2733690 RepID=A0A8H6XJX3_9AGAR|nr:MAPEG family [Mycena venus]